MEIPCEQVGLLAPAPLGGRVLYNGPFSADEWDMVNTQPPEIQTEETDKVESKPPLWDFSGSAWYWQNQNIGTSLVRKVGVPDRAIIKFDLAWKNRFSMAVGFHSDFTQPKVEEGDEEKRGNIHAGQPNSLPMIFGKSYVLLLNSNYVMLYRTTFDEEGRPRSEQVRSNSTSIRLGESGNASVELRCNRLSGEIALFIDGEFVSQWSELSNEADLAEGYAGLGDGMGFIVQSEDCAVRLSEMMIAEWNGMPDAARSMQIDELDIVLLSNGTDRLAGKVTGIQDGLLTLESRYGDFEFPMTDVAEVRFAKSQLVEAPEKTEDSLTVRLHPLGRISGKPLEGDDKTIRLLNSATGEINLNLDSAVMLEFESSGSFLDDWDVDF